MLSNIIVSILNFLFVSEMGLKGLNGAMAMCFVGFVGKSVVWLKFGCCEF